MMTWSAIVLQAALKGALIVALAGMATALLRHRSAALRHQVWTGAIIAQLGLLALVPVIPRISVPLLPRMSWSIEPRTDVASGDVNRAATRSAAREGQLRTPGTAGAPPADARGLQTDAAPTASSSSPNDASRNAANTNTHNATARGGMFSQLTWREILVGIWITGMVVVLLRFAYGTFAMARLAHRGERVEDGSWLTLTQRTAKKLGILRPLTLLRGDALSVPVTWGIIYPIVLLPTESAQWSEERRRFVLVHEMAHVKRFDALTQLVAQFAVAVFWFSPLVWFAEQRMRVEREHACDDVVLGEGTRPTIYADELLQMVRAMGSRQRSASAPAFAALAMARRSEFEGRMLAILDPSRPRAVSNVRGAALAALALILIAAPLAALSPFAAPAGPGDAALQGKTPSPSSSPSASTPLTASDAERTGSASGTANASDSGASHGIAGRIANAVSDAGRSVAASLTNCGRAKLNTGGSSTHINVDDSDAANLRTNYMVVADGRCLEGEIAGQVTLTADETSVTDAGAGALVYLRERTATLDRAVRIVRGRNGEPDYAFSVNGRRSAFDPTARAWVSRILPEVMRETGLNANRRVTYSLKAGGLSNALANIASIHNNSSKREHFTALLTRRTWRTPDVDRIVDAASTELQSSPQDLAAVLQEVPTQMQTPRTHSSLADALRAINSDGDKHSALSAMLEGADRETLLMIADVAGTINSDGDKSSLLVAAAPYFFAKKDGGLRTAFFRTYEKINSSGDRAVVLNATLKYAPGNEPLTLSIIRGVRNIDSSGNKAMVLTAVASKGLVTTPALRDAFAAEAGSSHLSDGDKAIVLSALMRSDKR